MSIIDNITIKVLSSNDLNEHSLSNFIRYQETSFVRYEKNGQYLIKEDHFIDDWNLIKKKQIIKHLIDNIYEGGIVIGAFFDAELVGFLCIESVYFGENLEYLELSYLHVSNEFRHLGIGKSMFKISCENAKQKGARKLYMGTHPGEETQRFYDSLGCVPALMLNDEIVEKEPLDLQIEYILD